MEEARSIGGLLTLYYRRLLFRTFFSVYCAWRGRIEFNSDINNAWWVVKWIHVIEVTDSRTQHWYHQGNLALEFSQCAIIQLGANSGNVPSSSWALTRCHLNCDFELYLLKQQVIIQAILTETMKIVIRKRIYIWIVIRRSLQLKINRSYDKNFIVKTTVHKTSQTWDNFNFFKLFGSLKISMILNLVCLNLS